MIFFTFLIFTHSFILQFALGKHFYIVDPSLTWTKAQNYCRFHFTDLSFVYSEEDQEDLMRASFNHSNPIGWIGLYLEPNDTVWKWSGAGPMTYEKWSPGQPDNNRGVETRGQVWRNGYWNDNREAIRYPFYCISVKMSWEEALNHCRKSNRSLPGNYSELHVQRKLEDFERMWVNLRYVGDRWLSLDEGLHKGQSLEQCPVKDRCAVLNKDGVLESWDCQDQLQFMCK